MLKTINVKLSSYLRNFRVLAEKEKVTKERKNQDTRATLIDEKLK